MSNQTNKISLTSAIIMGCTSMIGAGILTTPHELAQKVGPAGIVSFLLVAVSVWFLAQSFARVSQIYAQEGSFYIYAFQWGGHTAGLIASGCYIVGLLIALGLLTQQAGNYEHHYFSSMSPTALSLFTVVLIMVLNLLGAKVSTAGQKVLLSSTLFALVATIALCLTKAKLSNLAPFAPEGTWSILTSTSVVVFAFFGFEATTGW